MYSAFDDMEAAKCVFDEFSWNCVVSWTVLISGYAKIWDVYTAILVFDEPPLKDRGSWGAMISRYVQNNCFKELLQLFRLMQLSDIKPDEAIFVGILCACAHMGSLEIGIWIHSHIDPRHRYGHSLHLYYEEWCKTNAGQPFFYWLDLGDGKEVDLEECPRSKLRQQCIKYLGPKEREHYEYVVVHGKILHKQTGIPLDTNNGSLGLKWIFVMSTSKGLYIGEKKKGYFHHSSFLAGGTTLAAGRLIVEDGVLKVLFVLVVVFDDALCCARYGVGSSFFFLLA
ncbi:unnamed protein product [Fraxinus pennsylvanica]|uniref:Pentatricopeptide repeat-containing protein n=1 Tax=Fraxinus pennsylvanica TaxID=56036 RepID=A0AAD2DXF1_9LAMI|nr:unnamed protein product [Fraxinus pennsylvanica]